MSGCTEFDGGQTSFHVAGAVNETGANTVVRWTNGLPLVVVLDEHPTVERGRVVSVNFLPIPNLLERQTENEFWGIVVIDQFLQSRPCYEWLYAGRKCIAICYSADVSKKGRASCLRQLCMLSLNMNN